MTNLSSIVTLLQLVLTLLSNPSTANSTQIQTLATQAIGMATQALQTNTSIPVNSSNPISQNTTQSSTTGVPYCISYSGGNCIEWKYSNIPIPQINISQQQPQSNTTISTPSNINYINFDTQAVAASSQNLKNLQNAYSQALSNIENSRTNLAEAEGEKNNLNAVYIPQLQAAQLTLQNAEAQKNIDQQNYSISASTESQIESEQTQNEACSSSYNLNEAQGEIGIQKQEIANECLASSEKEANDIQNE